MNNLTEFEKNVLESVKKVLKGKVTTYSEIAKVISCPKAVRAVGNALHKNPEPQKVPCHRVVRGDGIIGGYAGRVKEKIKLLHDEGVEVRNNKVANFDKVLYKF